MDILRKSIIAALPFLLSGCYEDFDPRIDITPVICVNSLITAGEPIDVSVSRTWVYTDEEGEKDHSVKDATVKIFANGEPVGDDYLPSEGDVIRIEAHSDKYGYAEAEVMVPIAIQPSGIKYVPTLKYNRIRELNGRGIFVDLRFDIAIDITLPNEEESGHYYCLAEDTFYPMDHVIYFGSDDTNDEPQSPTIISSVNYYGGSFYCKDPFFYEHIGAFDDAMDYSWITEPLFFSNRQFSGSSEILHMGYTDASLYISYWNRNPEMLECGYEFTLYSISESYWKWLNYRWQSGESIMGDIIDFGLADPIWGYSNVSTGAGVVAAQSSATIKVSLKDYFDDTILDLLSDRE